MNDQQDEHEEEEKLDGKLVMKLIDISSDRDASMVQEFVIGQSILAAKCIGKALKKNTSIQSLTLSFTRQVVLERDHVREISSFIAECPSLKHLEIDTDDADDDEDDVEFTGGEDVIRELLRGATASRSLESFYFGKMVLPAGAVCLDFVDFLRSSTSQIRLLMIADGRASAEWARILAEKKSIESLQLLKSGMPVPHMFLSGVLSELTRSCASNIKQLQLDSWCTGLPTFLYHPSTAVEGLYLNEIDFRHDENKGTSPIDGLLWGLTGSKKTTLLSFNECWFDGLALQKILETLKSELTARTRLYFTDCFEENIPRDLIRDLLSIGCLEAFSLNEKWDSGETVAENTDFLRQGLQSCSDLLQVSSLKISCSDVPRLMTALTLPKTMHSLRALCLSEIVLEEGDTLSLVHFIKNTECRLKELVFDNCSDVDGRNWSTLLSAFQESPRLESLGVFFPEESFFDALISNIESIEFLKFLSLYLRDGLNENQTERLLGALRKNWSLEVVNVCTVPVDNCEFACSCRPLSRLSPYSHGKLEYVCERNKLKKAVATAEGNQTTVEWIGKLSDLVQLREGCSLSYWLFREQPDLFFQSFL